MSQSNEPNDSAEPLTPEEVQQYKGYTWGPYDTSRLFATIDSLTERSERAERDAEYNEHACEVSNRMPTATKVAAEHRIEERDPV